MLQPSSAQQCPAVPSSACIAFPHMQLSHHETKPTKHLSTRLHSNSPSRMGRANQDQRQRLIQDHLGTVLDNINLFPLPPMLACYVSIRRGLGLGGSIFSP